MRLDHVAIDGFKNLHGLELDFDETKLTTVIIGQNGSGKSNLIEAIVRVFRAYDLGEDYPQFKYRIIYRIQGFKVELSNLNARATVLLDGEALSLKNFSDRKSDIFPDMIFGYYSGSGRRLESLFDRHQARYYRHVYREDTDIDVAERERRLFFCRPVHGAMALLCQSAFPDEKIKRLLNQYLRIADVHSALAVLREPSWFNQNTWNKQANIYSFKLNGRPPLDRKLAWPIDMWGAKGIAGECTRNLRDSAFMPVAAVSKESDDYRNKPAEETQLGCFLRNQSAIDQFRQKYETDQKMFQALEALDISDLVRRITVWVNRTDVTTSEVSFSDLSDGERQLLMVLGLIRIARNKRVLFLLDEPDTHLNPVWQREYLRLLETWVEEVGTDRNCQFILTSHNPLTISALSKEEVRVMWQTEAGQVKAEEPYVDPCGLGFSSTLTEIFGLPSSLDVQTEEMLNNRDTLLVLERRSEQQQRQLEEINEKLDRLGFSIEHRDPSYSEYLSHLRDRELLDRHQLTPDQTRERDLAIRAILADLIGESERPLN